MRLERHRFRSKSIGVRLFGFAHFAFQFADLNVQVGMRCPLTSPLWSARIVAECRTDRSQRELSR